MSSSFLSSVIPGWIADAYDNPDLTGTSSMPSIFSSFLEEYADEFDVIR
jgi:hypothetical protein